MSKVDFEKIEKYLKANKKRKPEYFDVFNSFWWDALNDSYEGLSHTELHEVLDTEQYWAAFFFGAHQYIHGYLLRKE